MNFGDTKMTRVTGTVATVDFYTKCDEIGWVFYALQDVTVVSGEFETFRSEYVAAQEVPQLGQQEMARVSIVAWGFMEVAQVPFLHHMIYLYLSWKNMNDDYSDSHFVVKDLSSKVAQKTSSLVQFADLVQVASTRLEGELQAVADAQVAGLLLESEMVAPFLRAVFFFFFLRQSYCRWWTACLASWHVLRRDNVYRAGLLGWLDVTQE